MVLAENWSKLAEKPPPPPAKITSSQMPEKKLINIYLPRNLLHFQTDRRSAAVAVREWIEPLAVEELVQLQTPKPNRPSRLIPSAVAVAAVDVATRVDTENCPGKPI